MRPLVSITFSDGVVRSWLRFSSGCARASQNFQRASQTSLSCSCCLCKSLPLGRTEALDAACPEACSRQSYNLLRTSSSHALIRIVSTCISGRDLSVAKVEAERLTIDASWTFCFAACQQRHHGLIFPEVPRPAPGHTCRAAMGFGRELRFCAS